MDERIHHIYAIQSGEFIKVGRSVNVNERLESIRIGNPHPCEIIYSREVMAEFVKDAERLAHYILRHYWRRGEWFRTTPDVVIDAIDRCCPWKKEDPREAMERVFCAPRSAGES